MRASLGDIIFLATANLRVFFVLPMITLMTVCVLVSVLLWLVYAMGVGQATNDDKWKAGQAKMDGIPAVGPLHNVEFTTRRASPLLVWIILNYSA